MSAQLAKLNDALKQINIIQRDKNMLKLKSSMDKPLADLKSTVDKSMADLKMSIDQVNVNVANMTTGFQDLETHLDVVKVKMDETEMQNTFDHKEVSKHELEALAKV